MYCSRLWDFKLFRDWKACVTLARVLLSSSCNHMFKCGTFREAEIGWDVPEKLDLRRAARRFWCPGCLAQADRVVGQWPTEENKTKGVFTFAAFSAWGGDVQIAFHVGRRRDHLSLVLGPGSFPLRLAELLLYFVVQQRLVLVKRHDLVLAGI